MSYARLKLTYTKIADPNVEYIMRTTVDTTYSTPDEVDTCLVVKKGDAGVDEYLARIATFDDLITTPLEALPADVNLFSSPSLASIPGGILAGDVITIYETPFIWQQFFGAAVQESFTVNTVNNPTEVVVSSPFPAFGRNLKFYVKRGVTFILPASGLAGDYPIDGLANRDYTGVSGTYFRASSHADTWTDLTDANNAQLSFTGQAQTLVDDLNEDNYSGTFVETFE